MAFKNNYFDTALADEGILGTPLELLARATFGQESGSGRNASDSYAGAKGPMQVMPGTFKSVADQGWAIDDPYYNSRAGIRYLKQGWQASGGNPNLTAAYYYGGPGGMNKLANGIAVGDPRNPNAPNTKQYAEQVVGRMNIPNNGNNMAILNQAEPNQEPQYTPNPILRQNPDAGILERIANAPGLSQGLMQAGAGLLASTGDSNPLAMGLSRGLTGFNKGYGEGIENSKARAIPIAGGAFTQITDAQGNVTIVPNSEAQRFIRGLAQDKTIAGMEMYKFKQENANLTAGEQRELKEIDQGINDAGSKLSAVSKARTALNDPKLNDWTRIAASGLPFGKAVSEALGLPEADTNRLIDELKVDSWLVKSAMLKGAISDAENERLSKPMPSSFASKEKLLNWIDERETDLKKMQSGLQRIRDTDYRKGAKPAAPDTPAAPAANPVAPPGKVDSAPLAPVGGSDNPLNLNLPSLNRK